MSAIVSCKQARRPSSESGGCHRLPPPPAPSGGAFTQGQGRRCGCRGNQRHGVTAAAALAAVESDSRDRVRTARIET